MTSSLSREIPFRSDKLSNWQMEAVYSCLTSSMTLRLMQSGSAAESFRLLIMDNTVEAGWAYIEWGTKLLDIYIEPLCHYVKWCLFIAKIAFPHCVHVPPYTTIIKTSLIASAFPIPSENMLCCLLHFMMTADVKWCNNQQFLLVSMRSGLHIFLIWQLFIQIWFEDDMDI